MAILNSTRTSSFIRNAVTLVFCIGLFACQSQQPTEFVEAENFGEIGFSEKQIDENKYQVIFTGNAKTDINKAKDFALLHAANLTIEKGYTWFKVIDRDSDIEMKTVPKVAPTEARSTQVTSPCGILGCAISTASNYQGGQIRFEQIADKVVSTVLISMGTGSPENPNMVFDAVKVVENLGTATDSDA